MAADLQLSFSLGEIITALSAVAVIGWGLVKYILTRELQVRDKEFARFREDVMDSIESLTTSVDKLNVNFHKQDKQIAVIIAKQERN